MVLRPSIKTKKNFHNLCLHESDFGIPAEWHFSATSHGKGACDGIGGTVKRLAARASLQRPYNNQIMTPRQLFDWVSSNLPGVHFGYFSMVDYRREKAFLEQQFKQSRKIPGTRKFHSFIPFSHDQVEVKHFSTSKSFRKERVTLYKNDLPLDSISDFVHRKENGGWLV